MGREQLEILPNNQEKQENKTSENILNILSEDNFQDRISKLQEQVTDIKYLEAEAEEKRKEIFQKYKNKTISGEEYTKQVKDLLPWDVTDNLRYKLEKQIRELQVQQDVAWISQEQIFTNLSQLGENISDGWSNNKWVFLLWEKFVARKSARGYDDASRLILYKDKIQSSVIKKTLQIVELEGNVYQVQQRAMGKPILELSSDEKNHIPANHYKAFWDAIAEMRDLWLSLDISWWKSNVFYDNRQGFSIIDLWIGSFPENELIETHLFKK